MASVGDFFSHLETNGISKEKIELWKQIVTGEEQLIVGILSLEISSKQAWILPPNSSDNHS